METILDQPDTGFTPKYATFWARFFAIIIDSIVLGIAQFIIGLVVTGYAINIISIVIGWLYYTLQESSDAQATIGKKALGLRVTDLNGNRITFLNATGRYFGKILSAIILLIGFIMAAFDSKGQALHDKLAGTLVLRN